MGGWFAFGNISAFLLVSCLAKDTDIVDEAIYYFKANVFFKNYEIKVTSRDGDA